MNTAAEKLSDSEDGTGETVQSIPQYPWETDPTTPMDTEIHRFWYLKFLK